VRGGGVGKEDRLGGKPVICLIGELHVVCPWGVMCWFQRK